MPYKLKACYDASERGGVCLKNTQTDICVVGPGCLYQVAQCQETMTYGEVATRLLNIMSAAGFSILHDLPPNPPDKYNCPYSSVSAFALDPQRIDLEQLVKTGDLTRPQLNTYQALLASGNEGVEIREAKSEVLQQSAYQFMVAGSTERKADFKTWWETEKSWLEPCATFEILKGLPGNAGKSWQQWEVGKDFSPQLINDVKSSQEKPFTAICYEQWIAEQQALRYRDTAKELGIELWGDVPFYVGQGEVWANRELFNLDANGNQFTQAGCPPDNFSDTGQIWGNATYKVDANNPELNNKVIDWWGERLRRAHKISGGMTRLDHFIGLAGPYIIPTNRSDGLEGNATLPLALKYYDGSRYSFQTVCRYMLKTLAS